MSRKNFKVETAENGQTTIIKIDKTPTGKVKTIKDKEKIQKDREEQYKNFRVNALKRRAKRMGLTDEEIKTKVEELLNQINTPNSYDVLIFFNTKDLDLVKQALLKEELVWKIMSNSHLIMDADQETLATIRKIMPPSAKIHPYVKKKPSVLAKVESKKEKKPSNNKNGAPKAAKMARKNANKIGGKKLMKHRKRANVAAMSKENRKEFMKKVKALRASWKAAKSKKATTVQLKVKKGSKSLKKASMNLKKAA